MVEPPDPSKASQVLRLRIGEQSYNGLVVSMGDEGMMIATTLKEQPDIPIGELVQGEMPKPDGLYVFATRLRGMQLAPVLVMMLDRPKALRKIQRRNHPRYPVDLEARVIFISHEASINVEVTVENLAYGGLAIATPQAVPVGYHCIVLLQLEDHQLSTICTVIHSEGHGGLYHIGLAFTEMSRDDQDRLHDLIVALEQD